MRYDQVRPPAGTVPADARFGAGWRVGFQGEAGAFSEEALLALLPQAIPVPRRTFRDVVRGVEAGEHHAGLLAVENTLAGGVASAFDALQEGDVRVVREVIIGIRHFLMAVPGTLLDQVREVRSHPVALAQCERFFLEHPGVAAVPVHDTAGAAREVAQSGSATVAALAPRRAAERYALEILAGDLQDRDDNQTRFLLVQGSAALLEPDLRPHGGLKTSVVVETENRPGALHALLGVFAARGLDLTFIESRPTGTPWTYRFLLEFRHATPREADECLAAAAAPGRTIRVLGTFVPHAPVAPVTVGAAP
ncbi:MAG: prephenate dehydratase [Longimicrobiales bacterium]